jgi:hypothetical protein
MIITALRTWSTFVAQKNIRNRTVACIRERNVLDILIFQIEESENILFFSIQ